MLDLAFCVLPWRDGCAEPLAVGLRGFLLFASLLDWVPARMPGAPLALLLSGVAVLPGVGPGFASGVPSSFLLICNGGSCFFN